MKYFLTLGAILFASFAFSNTASASHIQGSVKNTEGAPIPFVRIRISGLQSGPYSRTVFSTDKGSFSVDVGSADLKKLEIDAFRIGWKETKRATVPTDSGLSLNLTFKSVKNVADQVPASAWLGGDTDSTAYHLTTIACTNCHQLGDRVQRFSSSLNGLSEAKRVEAWAAEFQHMRYVTMYLGEEGHYLGREDKLLWGLKTNSPAYNALLQADTSLFSSADEALMVPFLAHNFPTKFDNYTGYKDIERLGNYGVTGDTVIEEFLLPTFGWTREMAITPGSGRVWFPETDKDRIGGLDPQDGSVEWYQIPTSGPHGPHTMNPDAAGNVWITLENSFNLARFNPGTKEWRLYAPPVGKQFGVTHDIAYNSERFITADSTGRIWAADMGTNEMWAVNLDSGKIETIKLPTVGGETPFHSLLYGTVIDAKRDRVWWSQIFGGFVGSIDAKTDRIDHIIAFARGDGPRRLAIQDDGTLWVPLFGSSELVKVEPENGRVVGRFRIPDRGAAPYGVTMDNRRNAIWCATVNSDRIYRFDIKEERWTQYPMPRKEGYIRMIQVDKETGDVWTSYSNLPPGHRDPKVFGTESANNMLVRLRPGH